MSKTESVKSDVPSCRVLVVEDEWIVAFDMQELLADAGYKVVGPASRVPEALQLISDEEIDIALLDMNLAGESSEPIATRLLDLGKPFIFLSGHSSTHLDPKFRTAPHLSKPVSEGRLLECLASMLAQDDSN